MQKSQGEQFSLGIILLFIGLANLSNSRRWKAAESSVKPPKKPKNPKA